MGQVASRVQAALRRPEPAPTEDVDPENQLAYPGAAGSYFGSHFLMCGGRFDMVKPESYLFGENSDLDLLGCRPVPFPYSSPLGSNECHPLNLLVNVRKESVKFTRIREEDNSLSPNLFRLDFTLDSDCSCFVQIHFNTRELYQDKEIHFAYRNKRVVHSERYHFDMGSDQAFSNYVFDLSKWNLDDLHYSGGHYFPLVIVVQTDDSEIVQTQTTMCTIEQANDSSNGLVLKPLRQKIACDGAIYLLQEIFGIENKESISDSEDNGLECIICMSDVRDTVILPCRHLCICNSCADTLRYKLNNCPICRSPFRALIQLKARRLNRNQGFETVTLVEGLNGVLNQPSYRMETHENEEAVDEGDEQRGEETKKRKTHSRQASRTVVHEMVPIQERYSVSETHDGIEMKQYVQKSSVQSIAVNESPPMSSRSHSPIQSANPEEVDIELGRDRVLIRRGEDSSGQSSSGLLTEDEGGHTNPVMPHDD